MGTSLPNIATWSLGNDDGMSGVQTGPGATPLTRIFLLAKFDDNARVKAIIAPFVDE
jgi:hypothetical protein